MQDRFKFRVWCENKKQWEKDEILISSLNHYVVNTTERRAITSEEPKFHKICLSTGWKDKNSKIVYSGDLVKQNYSTYVVEVCPGGFQCRNIRTKSLYQFSVLSDKHAEVIGNIYENPELLEDAQCQK